MQVPWVGARGGETASAKELTLRWLSSIETSLFCTAGDFEKIAPGRENCAEIVRRSLPA